MINANPKAQAEMFARFHGIIAKQKANRGVNEMFVQSLEKAEQDLYDGFWGGIILEFAPHIFLKEVETVKQNACNPVEPQTTIDPVLLAFGAGNEVNEDVLQVTRKRFVLPEPTIKSALDEFTLYQLSQYKEKQ